PRLRQFPWHKLSVLLRRLPRNRIQPLPRQSRRNPREWSNLPQAKPPANFIPTAPVIGFVKSASNFIARFAWRPSAPLPAPTIFAANAAPRSCPPAFALSPKKKNRQKFIPTPNCWVAALVSVLPQCWLELESGQGSPP